MFSKIMSFAMAIASRGLKNNKIDVETKKLRHVSCYGLNDISPCKYLTKSDKSNHFYCKSCNCGDHPHTWLEREDGIYSKLDYPQLNCPLKMPGFTNYDPNSPLEENERKKQIESMNFDNLKLITLTVSVDKEKEEIFEQINNIIKN
jgi:hypothetical protein